MATPSFPADPTSLAEELLRWAVSEGATDIHFVPRSDDCVVRARIDGLLRDIHTLDKVLYTKTVSRIKVLADIDIAEKRRPQDGRLSFLFEERPVDFRLSSIPTLHGESLALRVLDRTAGLRALDQLGLSTREIRTIRSFLSHSSGLIIVTGPTGAGKTTTMYAALQELAVPERNVLSIEDPIEYEISGVVQTAVQAKIDVTFAGLLRSILRHDPDVIMVGEVRDAETAEVAVRAALTGHLVLTSLHTQRAADAVSALLNLGVRPYALAPALKAVVAQQLVREICPKCRSSFEYGDSILSDPDCADLLPEGTKPSFSIGLGCEECFGSGYRGRRGIFEILDVSPEIQKMILQSRGAGEIESEALKGGMVTLRKSGFRAVLEGHTTVEEVVRAVQIE